MKNPFIHSLLSIFLAILLLFGTVSKEFVHGFASHQDTTSCLHPHEGGPVWDPPHHHCDFLSFVLSAFHAVPLWTVIESLQEMAFHYPPPGPSFLDSKAMGSPPVRGPPGAEFISGPLG